MAHVLTLTDTSTNITLTSGVYTTLNYEMGTLDAEKAQMTETVELLISGTISQIEAASRAVEQMMEAAKRRQRLGAGPRIYLNVQWDGDATTWSGEIYDGRLETTEAPDQLRRGKVEAALVLTRGPLEGPLTQLSLSNGNGSGTAALAVYNCNDGTGTSPNKKNNYLAIGSAAVAGALPAPVTLQLTAASGSAQYWRQYWLATNSFNDPSNFTHIIEGESRVSGYGTVTAAAGVTSGGQYNYLGIVGSGAMHWDLTASFVQDCAGYPFRILARLYTTPVAGYMQACIYDSSGLILLSAGDWVETATTSNKLVDLGVLSIPPDEYSVSYGALRLVIKFNVTGTQNIGLDFVTFLPADTARLLVQRGMTLSDGDIVVLDESKPRAYVTSGGVEYPLLILRGKPIMLEPGKDTRIYILATDSTADVDVADKWTAQAWYRPRRWTL